MSQPTWALPSGTSLPNDGFLDFAPDPARSYTHDNVPYDAFNVARRLASRNTAMNRATSDVLS